MPDAIKDLRELVGQTIPISRHSQAVAAVGIAIPRRLAASSSQAASPAPSAFASPPPWATAGSDLWSLGHDAPLDRSPEATFRRLDGVMHHRLDTSRCRQRRLDLATGLLFSLGTAAGLAIGIGLGALAVTVGG